MARVKRLTAAMTKSQMMADIAENTGLSKRDVASVFAAMETVIERHIKKGSVGYCTVPGLMKIKPNPFRPGELMDMKAKPASRRVKILALKKLKDMA